MNNQHPMKGIATILAAKGRGPDTQLMHVTDAELAGLASLHPTGKMPINPDTGLPEAGWWDTWGKAAAWAAAAYGASKSEKKQSKKNKKKFEKGEEDKRAKSDQGLQNAYRKARPDLGDGRIDPVDVQAGLRGSYSVAPPAGYRPGIDPEFNYFQNDPNNIQAPDQTSQAHYASMYPELNRMAQPTQPYFDSMRWSPEGDPAAPPQQPPGGFGSNLPPQASMGPTQSSDAGGKPQGDPWAGDAAAQAWFLTPEGQQWRASRSPDGSYPGARTSQFIDVNQDGTDDRDQPWLHQGNGQQGGRASDYAGVGGVAPAVAAGLREGADSGVGAISNTGIGAIRGGEGALGGGGSSRGNFDMMGNLGLGWMNPPQSGGTPYANNYGGYGSDGSPSSLGAKMSNINWSQLGENAFRGLSPLIASNYVPFSGRLLDNYLDNQMLWGSQQGMMSPSSPDFVPPGGGGGVSGGGGSSGGASSGGGNTGRYGASSGYSSNGSITSGGAVNYATRLRLNSHAAGGQVMLSLGGMQTPMAEGGITGIQNEFTEPMQAPMQENMQAPTQDHTQEPTQEDITTLAGALLGRVEGGADQIVEGFIQKYGNEIFLVFRQMILQQGNPDAQTEGMIEGQGGGMDDEVMGTIGDQQPVAVSPGEYIVSADVVSGLGDGSSDAGARELDAMMDRTRMARGGNTTQPPPFNARGVLPK